MSIKKTLVGNLFGQFRNGMLFKTVTFPGEGTFICGIGNNFTAPADEWENYDEWNPVSMMAYNNVTSHSISEEECDIIELYRPDRITDLLDPSITIDYVRENAELIWKEKTLESAAKSDFNNYVNSVSSNADDGREIKVTTSIEVKINDQSVDLNNLTEEQHKLLKFMGII